MATPQESIAAPTDADTRLRWTVRQLGNLLGETIVEQEGQAIFDLVEELRSLTRAQRQGDLSAGTRIEQRTSRLVDDLEGTLGVLKAFTTYFQLVNLAEEQQRVRVVRQRRARAEEEGRPMPETIAAAVEGLRAGGTPPRELRQLLQELLISRRANHAVNIIMIAHHNDRLNLARVHGAVFKVKPDAVKSAVGRVADVEGKIVAQSANAGKAAAAELL